MVDVVNISTADTTASNNASLNGVSILGTGLVSTADDTFRNEMALLAKWWNDLGGVNTVGGSGDAVTITTLTTYTAYKTGMRLVWIQGSANTTAVTANLDAIGAKAVRKISGGVDVALSAGDLPAGARIEAIYSAAANSAVGGLVILSVSVAAATTSSSGIVELATPAEAATGTDAVRAVTPSDIGQFGWALAASVGSNALTVSLKHISGADPSATIPVLIPFRSATAAIGAPDPLAAVAATSIVISSGSTMGFTSAVIGRLWVVAFNDAGTLRLGLVNALSGTSIMSLRNGIASSTAEGGAGAADSAQVFYTGTAVTSKAYTVLGFLDATEATAGTWATAPSRLKVYQPGDPLPGDRIQRLVDQDGTLASGTTTSPTDNTIPQNTEGTEFMTQAITPSSAANLLRITHTGSYASSATGTVTAALFQDSAADALAANGQLIGAVNNTIILSLDYTTKAGTAGSTTFRVRTGNNAAGTVRFNGFNTAQLYGGVANSSLTIEELMG